MTNFKQIKFCGSQRSVPTLMNLFSLHNQGILFYQNKTTDENCGFSESLNWFPYWFQLNGFFLSAPRRKLNCNLDSNIKSELFWRNCYFQISETYRYFRRERRKCRMFYEIEVALIKISENIYSSHHASTEKSTIEEKTIFYVARKCSSLCWEKVFVLPFIPHFDNNLIYCWARNSMHHKCFQETNKSLSNSVIAFGSESCWLLAFHQSFSKQLRALEIPIDLAIITGKTRRMHIAISKMWIEQMQFE